MSLIMVVDDDQDLGEMLGIVLRGAGFDVDIVDRGDLVIERFRKSKPDLILLDVMLPGVDGIELCQQIRQESQIPIVMLTAKGDTEDVIRGLEIGADDYLVKPFNSQELVARLKVRLRRTTPSAVGLRIGDLVIDENAHSIIRAGKSIPLTKLEFDLLVALAKDPSRVFTREALLSEVWGYRHATDTRLVNVHIQRLRSKIEIDPENPELIITVRGVGYRAGGAGVSEK
jgi:two-component system, OmpR family, response regulator MtrA